MQRKIVLDKIIPPQSVLAFTIKKGQFLRVIDIEGKQVGDLALFNEEDHTEKLSVSYTRCCVIRREYPRWWTTWRVTTGNQLLSALWNPMMTITADTQVPGGVHDTMLKTCCSRIYELGGVGPRDGCLELLANALEPYGIAKGDIPDTFNIFMNVNYDTTCGMVSIDEPVSRPGDYIELRAEMDCLAALTTCPDDVLSPCNGPSPHPPKPLQFQIWAV